MFYAPSYQLSTCMTYFPANSAPKARPLSGFRNKANIEMLRKPKRRPKQQTVIYLCSSHSPSTPLNSIFVLRASKLHSK